MVLITDNGWLNDADKEFELTERQNLKVEIATAFEKIRQEYPDMDIRTAHIHSIFDVITNGNSLINKVPRSGATTSLGIDFFLRNEQTLLVVPTHKIAERTIKQDIKKILAKSGNHVKIVQIYSNHRCEHNKIAFKEYTDLRELQFLTRKSSCMESCKYYDKCDLMEILKHPDADLFVITADKLAALVLSASAKNESEGQSYASRVLDIILNVKNVVFDEIHWMQSYTQVNLTMDKYKIDSGVLSKVDYDYKYGKVILDSPEEKKYRHVAGVLIDFPRLLNEQMFSSESVNNVGPGKNEVDNEVTVDISDRIVENPIYRARKEIMEEAKASDYSRKHINKILYNPIFDPDVHVGKQAIVLCTELMNMIMNEEHNSKYKLNTEELNNIFDMASIINSQKVQVNAIRSGNNISVKITGYSRIKLSMLKEFIKLIHETGEKRVIFTSATAGTFPYDTLLPAGSKFKKIIFADDGDPKNTNALMKVFSDNRRLNLKDCYSRMNEIIYNLTHLIDEFGEILIIALNMELAIAIQDKLEEAGYDNPVTYYGSDLTVGVTSNCRVGAVICAAYAPPNWPDTITNSREESDIVLEDVKDATSCQAAQRVKDPDGLVPSCLYTIGVTEEQNHQIYTHGTNRKITIGEFENGQKKPITVTCEEYVTKPVIVQYGDFATSFAMMKDHMCDKSMSPDRSKEQIAVGKELSKMLCAQRPPIINNIGGRDAIEVSNVGFHNLISKCIMSGDVDLSKLTEKRIGRHISGKEPIKIPVVSKDGVSNFVLFKDIKLDKDVVRLCSYLSQKNLPYVVEHNDKNESYNVWLFIKPIKAIRAKSFCEQVLRNIRDIKKIPLYCDVLPKITNRRSVGFDKQNEIKLLLCNTKVLIDGEFVNYPESLSVEIADLEPFLKYMELHEQATVAGFNNNREEQIRLINELNDCDPF